MPKRAQWAKGAGWQTLDQRPIRVAVALSGGGYRAATIHAGFLKALDEHCVPTRYLTTVSGGSIIGAYYALGYPPDSFKKMLAHETPGLPDDIANIWWASANWWLPGWSNADTYSHHLSNVFFGSRTLDDTGVTPQILVNATDLENLDSNQVREVFFLGRNEQFPELDKTKVADIVAASAAFPGAFQPKRIYWPLGWSDEAPQNRRFVDGGVVENLGYSGLARFLEIKTQLRLKGQLRTLDDTALKPDLFIVSDASAALSIGPLPDKVGLLELLSRSQDVSYWIEHNLLRTAIAMPPLERTDLRFDKTIFVRALDKENERPLQASWFSSKQSTNKIRGDEMAKEVAYYPTLRELNSDEVEKAFWLGYTLGQIHWPEIDEWRKVRARGPSCAH